MTTQETRTVEKWRGRAIDILLWIGVASVTACITLAVMGLYDHGPWADWIRRPRAVNPPAGVKSAPPPPPEPAPPPALGPSHDPSGLPRGERPRQAATVTGGERKKLTRSKAKTSQSKTSRRGGRHRGSAQGALTPLF